MASWRKWQTMAEELLESAVILHDQEKWRSSASRYYYAAFQMATAVLLYLRATPLDDAEGWSHAETPDLLRTRL